MADEYRNALMPDQQMVGGEPQQSWVNALMQQAWGARPWQNIDVVNPDKSAMLNGLLTAGAFMAPGVGQGMRMPQRAMSPAGGSGGGAMSLEELMAQRPQRTGDLRDEIGQAAQPTAQGQAMTPEMMARRAAMQAEADRLRALAQERMTPGPSVGDGAMTLEEMMARGKR